jgi:hypothetical protein
MDDTTGVSGTVGSSDLTTLTTPAAGVTVVSPITVNAGDKVTVEVFGVVNGQSAGPVSDFSVSTSSDPVAVAAPQFSLASAATSGATSVTVNPNTAGSTSSVLVQGLVVPSGGIAAGTSVTFAQSAGVSFPNSVSAYTLSDATTPADSQSPSSASGTATGLTLTLSKPLLAGDVVSLSVAGAINPPRGGSFTLFTTFFNAPATSVSATPNAATTDSNGALIQSGGQIDVIAGGFAFGIPSFADYQKIAGMVGTTVVSGTFPTATTPRAGTLIQPIGQAGIWVVGTNGELYQFSSGAQFMADGYSGMEVIPVPSAGGLTVATGVPPTAAVTTPDGAIVQYGSTLYVYAGGTPFGIPTFADYQKIAGMTGSMVVQGSGTTPVASATTANGVLVQPIGAAGIWVTFNGTLYPFSSPAQLQSDGYNGMYTIPTPGTGSLVVS